MKLDLTKLYAGTENIINLHEDVQIPKEMYEKMSILELTDVKLDGKVYKDWDEVK